MAWSAWTIEGLVSLCGAKGIKLANSNASKQSIIKTMISNFIKFTDPPPNFRAAAITDPTSAGLRLAPNRH